MKRIWPAPDAACSRQSRGAELGSRVVQAALRGYQRWLSPLLPPACRYVPTCSEYAREAVARFGVLRGGALAVARLLRCHPFARGGYDPVPGPKCERRPDVGRHSRVTSQKESQDLIAG